MKKVFLLIAMLCSLGASAAIRGDINNDKTVDVSDLNIAINIILNLDNAAKYNGRADLNGDKITDVADLNTIINIILGLEKEPHDFVDLGLPSGTLWATCNVGAEKPEEPGLYFAWGDSIGYTVDEGHDFSWKTYKWCNTDLYHLTKYCNNSNYWDSSLGSPDNKTFLEAKDDAATFNWGSDWRMPTEAEVTELSRECLFSLTSVNNITGYKIKGPNGNSIFLPFAGKISDTEHSGYKSGYYWTNEVHRPYSYNAYYKLISSYSSPTDTYYRYSGLTVRAVCVKKANR